MGTNGSEAAAVNGVFDTEFGARLFHDARDAGVVDVAHTGKQVMLDLEVEAPDVPTQDTIALREVRGGLHLVHRPGPFYSPAWIGMWKRDLLDTVRQLKDQDEDEAQHY